MWLLHWSFLELGLALVIVSMSLNAVFFFASGRTSVRGFGRPLAAASLGLLGTILGTAVLVFVLSRAPLVTTTGPGWCIFEISLLTLNIVLGLVTSLRQYWPQIPKTSWPFGLGLLALTTAVAWLIVALS
ncbi:MAG: hypothetical protein ACOYKZ_08235 [Chlamydiia bacterium]